MKRIYIISKIISYLTVNYFKIILKYSLYRSNFDVFCFINSFSNNTTYIAPFARYALGNQYNKCFFFFFKFKCFCLNSCDTTF